MRVLLLAVALVGLTSLPTAAANANAAPVAVVLFQNDDGEAYLSWSPAPHAVAYLILAGESEDTLEPVDETMSTFYRVPQGIRASYIGVASLSGTGEQSAPRALPTDARGDCVATNTKAQFSLSLRNCVNLIP